MPTTKPLLSSEERQARLVELAVAGELSDCVICRRQFAKWVGYIVATCPWCVLLSTRKRAANGSSIANRWSLLAQEACEKQEWIRQIS